MDDLISRKALLEAVNDCHWKSMAGNNWARKEELLPMIERLPSGHTQQAADLISRQDAIDALEWKWAGKAAIDSIKNLPSAQPEARTEMSSPKNSERTTESSQNVQDDDLIFRKAAINALDEQYWNLLGILDIPICKEIRNAATDTIKALPSAQPEIIRCLDCIKADLCAWRREGAKYCSFAERRTDE